MPNTFADDSVLLLAQRYQRRTGQKPEPMVVVVKRWAEEGSEADRDAALEMLRGLGSARTNTPDGPTFWYGSGALVNQRLLDVRLEACFDGDETAAFVEAAAHRECAGELAVLAARFAERAGRGSYGVLLGGATNDLAGVVEAMAATEPDILVKTFKDILNKSSLKVFAKLRLAGVLDWDEGEHAQDGDTSIWVTSWHTLVMTVKTTGKKGTFAFKVAKSREKVAAAVEKARAAAVKKHGVTFAPGKPVIADLTSPTAADADVEKIRNANDRATLLRLLREMPAGEIPEAFVWGREDFFVYDFLRHGWRLPAGANEERVAGHVASLTRNLLPSAFEQVSSSLGGA